MRTCEICGETKGRITKASNGQILCSKHYQRLMKQGDANARTKYDLNQFKVHEGYTEMLLYDAFGKEKARTMISSDKVSLVSGIKWSLTAAGYVFNSSNEIYLHKLIANEFELEVDHIDGNPLNNLDSNLRVCEHKDNLKNQKTRKTNTSGKSGVYFDKSRDKWVAQIMLDGKNKHLGRFDEYEDAVKAREDAETLYFGEFKRGGNTHV